MANYLELATQAYGQIQDSSFTVAVIKPYLNRGMKLIAGGILKEGNVLTLPLPGLYTIGTVATSTSLAYVALPSNYQRDVVAAVDDDGRRLEIYDSFLEFVDSYPGMDNSGNLHSTAVMGRNLYYQDIPTTSENVTIHYYRYPVDMSSDTDEPDGIPVHLHYDLLVNYACKEIFHQIEDGIEGNMPNTNKYAALFMNAVQTLEASIPLNGESMYLKGNRSYHFFIT